MTDQARPQSPLDAQKEMFAWDMIGIPVILALGTALHFLFEWTKCWAPVATIAPVNESVWEHFKLSFWPGLLYAAVEWPSIGRRVNNYWVGKAVGLVLMPAIVGLGFYAYTAVWKSSLIPNIVLLALAIAIGQWASYRIAIAGRCRRWIAVCVLCALVLTAAGFAAFGYVPPRIFLFCDPLTQTYGIPQR